MYLLRHSMFIWVILGLLIHGTISAHDDVPLISFTLKSCNILIFDRQQRLVYKTTVQKPDPQKLEEIMNSAK